MFRLKGSDGAEASKIAQIDNTYIRVVLIDLYIFSLTTFN